MAGMEKEMKGYGKNRRFYWLTVHEPRPSPRRRADSPSFYIQQLGRTTSLRQQRDMVEIDVMKFMNAVKGLYQ